jgi:hypothetical protein
MQQLLPNETWGQIAMHMDINTYRNFKISHKDFNNKIISDTRYQYKMGTFENLDILFRLIIGNDDNDFLEYLLTHTDFDPSTDNNWATRYATTFGYPRVFKTLINQEKVYTSIKTEILLEYLVSLDREVFYTKTEKRNIPGKNLEEMWKCVLQNKNLCFDQKSILRSYDKYVGWGNVSILKEYFISKRITIDDIKNNNTFSLYNGVSSLFLLACSQGDTYIPNLILADGNFELGKCTFNCLIEGKNTELAKIILKDSRSDAFFKEPLKIKNDSGVQVLKIILDDKRFDFSNHSYLLPSLCYKSKIESLKLIITYENLDFSLVYNQCDFESKTINNILLHDGRLDIIKLIKKKAPRIFNQIGEYYNY